MVAILPVLRWLREPLGALAIVLALFAALQPAPAAPAEVALCLGTGGSAHEPGGSGPCWDCLPAALPVPAVAFVLPQPPRRLPAALVAERRWAGVAPSARIRGPPGRLLPA